MTTTKLPPSPAVTAPVTRMAIPADATGQRQLLDWFTTAYDDGTLPALPLTLSPGVTLLGYDALLSDVNHERKAANSGSKARLTTGERQGLLQSLQALQGCISAEQIYEMANEIEMEDLAA